jgi:hypothetical protein
MQDIIVYLIGILVFGYLVYLVIKTLTKKASPSDSCGGCTGCALKEKSNCNLEI